MNHPYDLIVIGGGRSGVAAAELAASLHRRVALIDDNDCLSPSTLAADLRRVLAGASAEVPGLALSLVQERAEALRRTLPHKRHLQSLGVEVISGRAAFQNPRTIIINGMPLIARQFIIATGSSPTLPPVAGLEQVGYYLPEEVDQIERIPKRLAIIGRGLASGIYAQAFRRLGARVTRLDPSLTSLASIQPLQKSFQLNYTGPEPTCLTTEAILMVPNRLANLNLNLESAAVDYGPEGIMSNHRGQTSQRHILSFGSCVAT